MSSHVHQDDTHVTEQAQLIAYIEAGYKKQEAWVVGTEHEKFGWWADRACPPDYFDERGIGALLDCFAENGWQGSREDGRLLALARNGATITLEPGGQLELSGAPLRSLLDTERELDDHLAELAIHSETLGLSWSGIGFMPWKTPEDMPVMPKPRYGILEQYLRSVGQHGVHMMRQTATVQANLDFSDEQDAMRKWRAALYAQPIVTAIFANSPMVAGQFGPHDSFRARVWQDTAPDRCRLPDSLLGGQPSLEDYVQWTMDVPMLFIHRDDRYVDMRGPTFRQFMESGADEYQASIGDYALHLSTLFPDVRLKQFMEVRAADMGSREYVLALPAFHVGFLYDEIALEKTLALFEPLGVDDWRQANAMVPHHGFSTRLGLRPIGEWAEELFRIAQEGLSRWEPAALPLLNALEENILRRQSPATLLRSDPDASAEDVLEKTRLF